MSHPELTQDYDCEQCDQQPDECECECKRCSYEEAEYREQWQKVLCAQCNLDYDSPSQEELESRM